MSTFRDLSSALSETLCESDLSGVTVELAEAVSDTLFEDGLAKEIPVIGTIYALGKFGITVRDRLFLKKLLSFMSEVKDVPAGDREKMISRIDRSGEYQIKVGEKLLYILDRSEDHENSRIVAYLFRAFLCDELSYDGFLRASRAVQSIIVNDLWRFVDDEKEWWDAWDVGGLLNAGLIKFDEQQVRVKDHDPGDWKHGDKYDVHGAELTASITGLGTKVRAILRSRRATMHSSEGTSSRKEGKRGGGGSVTRD